MTYTYNGVVIQLSRTLNFEMDQEKDPSGVDALYNKYSIRVRGFITPSDIEFPKNSAATLQQLKTKLETPRRAFTYKIGDTTLVNTRGVDAKYGPMPLPVSIREVTSGTFMVECGVVVHIAEPCAATCPLIPDLVVSLRWSQTESFDQNWNSHLTTSGKLIVNSSFLLTADSFRVLTVPPLLTDYIRVKSKYNLSSDGTMLDFEFDDMEVDRLPPAPATKATGSLTIQLKNGGVRMGIAQIGLEGPKGTSRRTLMLRAIQIAYTRLEQEYSFHPSWTPVYDGSFKEDLFEPKVEVMIAMKLPLWTPNIAEGALAVARAVLGGVDLFSGVPGLAAPAVFPSVGNVPPGCNMESNRSGIAPPDRKRLKALLAQAFSDPCCLK